jgi:pyruvate/2-oxoglutarate dehydrogenase complex dihydrolipoamide dehydrogenase (E3) component
MTTREQDQLSRRHAGEGGGSKPAAQRGSGGTTSHYDLIVIGSGQCGNPLADAFHAAGKRVAVVERGAVGGTCVNFGCTPTKTMVASAEVAQLARRAAEFGIDAGPVTANMRAIVERKRGIVAASRGSSEKRFNNGIDLLRGTASFTGPRSVRVQLNNGGDRELSAAIVVIDAGLSPALPHVNGIDKVDVLDNVSIMELEQLPEHLLVLGGGYVGLEFAQMFRRFGSKVTIIQKGPHLLQHEDADVADAVVAILREDGIEVLLDAQAREASSTASGIELTVEAAGAARVLKGTHLLNATGRSPNTAALNLAAAGITADAHGFIPVNEKLETAAAGIYAVGDVNGGPAFTHISYDDFRILKANLLDGGHRVTTGRPLPYCVFIDPQLGRIGLSENEARRTGRAYKLAKIQMSSVARAFETGQTRGFMKALVDPDSEEILGAAILSADAGELMSMIEIAMMGKLSYKALQNGIFAHPTFAESLNTLFMTLEPK